MTRRKIGAALLGAMGIAKAQNKEQDTPGLVVGWPPPTGCHSVDGYAPCNSPETKDVCPLCGTKAEAYVRLTEAELLQPHCAHTTRSGFEIQAHAVCIPPSTTTRFGPMERVARCKRCNNAFWQDATE